ncbi:hypothetical protein N3K66_001787 [Trichothecium roseum]|uniref:Uncharacterized protein n=1 Tax=Trichothecium roseum TaxID=47278 RepID=A0ACC0V9N7_9HYPO|nr:hypothetical protein N3K66_001787 [Trichothecium roseum]
MNGKGAVELYIPPVSRTDASRNQAFRVAVRNIFAWAFQRSLVGEHLGPALVELLDSMHEYRSEGCDNDQDMMSYLDEEGYLDIANQPDHALAMLYMAETLKMRDLYIRAFVHCVGMHHQLYSSSEYEIISFESKKLIRKARWGMEARLSSATDMLKNFLDKELSDAHLGIPPSARAHLERFRSFLLSFYASRMGYYPPRTFDASLLQTMRREFGALYELLVDDGYTTSDTMPPVAVGGMCTIQLIHAFNQNQGFKALEHPLPLLPEYAPSSRFLPWRSRRTKLKPNERLLAHTSLIMASNWKDAIFNNELVKAYRRFEEDATLGTKRSDKQEKVSLVDARKVRWIMIYATYQVVRSVTEIAPEVYDADEASYPVIASVRNLPPWDETTVHVPRPPSRDANTQLAPSVYWGDSADSTPVPGKIEIKPDIDYFAITHREPCQLGRRSSCVVPSKKTSSSSPPTRSNSVSFSLSRRATLRRSLRKFKPGSGSISSSAPVSPSKQTHHEIVVHGYGNGTNKVHVDQRPRQLEEAVSRSTSVRTVDTTMEDKTEVSSQNSNDSDDTIDTLQMPDTPHTLDMPPGSLEPNLGEDPALGSNNTKRKVVSMFISPSRANSLKSRGSIRRPMGNMFNYANFQNSHAHDGWLGQQQQQRKKSLDSEPPTPPPRRRYSMFGGDTKRNYVMPEPPQPIIEDDWAALQAFMDGNNQSKEPAWEQYAELGGLTEMAR